jgi:hypothetical protein
MRFVFCSLFLLFFVLPIHAQNHSFDLAGILIIKGLKPMPYHLVLNENKGKISGYSVTNAKQKDETKAEINGYVDKYKRQLIIRETGIIGSSQKNDTDIMCMVNATLNYKETKQVVVFNGTFLGKDVKTGAACASGSINLSSYAELPQLFESEEKKDSLMQATIIKPAVKMATKSTDSFSAVDEITKGIETVYDWRSDSVVFDLWDGGKVDNDVVCILFNTDTLLKHYTLKAEKLRLRVALSKTQNIDKLQIVAENEGSEPPNTANIMLIDENKKYNVIAYNDLGNKATINIKHKAIK